jgi:hypothetical protein
MRWSLSLALIGLPRPRWVQDPHREGAAGVERLDACSVVLELAELAFSNIFDFIEVHADGSVQIDLFRATRD